LPERDSYDSCDSWFPRSPPPMPALDHLASLFYDDLAELGTFEEVLA
jgi:hypothetical protein